MLIWSKNLELNIEIIDEQHKGIFEEINKLIKSFEKHSEIDQTYEVLEFVEKYVKKHFQTEEFYLEKYKYHDLAEHKKMHEAFSEKLAEYKDSFKRSGITRIAALQMFDFLIKWWNNHILKVDTKYVDWLKDRLKTG